MKYTAIILMLMSIHVSMAFINAMGVFTESRQPNMSWLEKQIANTAGSYTQSEVVSDNSLGFGDFVKGLFYFVGSFGLGVIIVPYTLAAFGLTAPWTYFLSIPVYAIYTIALIQIIANRPFKSFE